MNDVMAKAASLVHSHASAPKVDDPPTALEAALSEDISAGGMLSSEEEALHLIGLCRSIVYTATDEGDDVAYYEDADKSKELQKHGFKALDALGLAGGIVLKHVPLKVDALTFAGAEEVVQIMDELPRPTHVVCKSGARASAAKALYVARMAGLKDELDRYAQTEQDTAWRKNAAFKAWVLGALKQHQEEDKGGEGEGGPLPPESE